jgi:hypothetical protein
MEHLDGREEKTILGGPNNFVFPRRLPPGTS